MLPACLPARRREYNRRVREVVEESWVEEGAPDDEDEDEEESAEGEGAAAAGGDDGDAKDEAGAAGDK